MLHKLFSSLPYSLILSSLFIATTSLPVESAELRQFTNADFSDTKPEGRWFIEFYSPFCPHCRHFAPTWERLVDHIASQDDPGISLARVNCVVQGDLCTAKDVNGYPSLKLYEDGKEIGEFQESREFDLLASYLKENARKSPSTPPPPPPPPPSEPVFIPNPKGQVLSLDYSTFPETIDQGPTFVKFFAPWCGHCKKLAPIWAQFAFQMQEKVTVAEVNCDDHKVLCKMQKIQGYPTIFFYQHGRTHDYTGRRTLEALEAFVDAALAPPLATITLPDLKSVVEQDEVVYVLIHDKLDENIRDNVEEASQPLHGSPKIFSMQHSADLLSAVSLPLTQPLPALVSLKDHSLEADHQLVLSSASTQDNIWNWLLKHSLPSSTPLAAENFAKVMGSSPVPTGTPERLIVLAALSEGDPIHIERMREAAKAWHKGHKYEDKQVVFAWMDRGKWASWLKSVYGIKANVEPAVVVVDHSRLLYYDSFPDGSRIDLDLNSITAAVEGVQNGKLKAKHSENIAERFVRQFNNWISGIQTAIYNHPIRTVLLFVGLAIGIFWGIKRLLDEDSKRSYGSVYVNSKSGGRLD
ncbi:thioredoxin-like protein [Hysterangium stoloniferum]|nr:thioredoxin-like protein [Hysterangium stoloniferum]